MKKALNSLIVAVLIISTLPFSKNTASADHLYPAFQKCEEITQYFDPALPLAQANDVLNNIQQNCENLNHHNAFPGSHKGNIQLNQHKPSVKVSHQPRTQHNHKYFNQSEESLNETIIVNGNEQLVNFYFQSYLDTFELHLESDLVQNGDLNTLECSGLQNGQNCNGTGTMGENSNGKDVFFEVSFDKNACIANSANCVIKWHFPGQSKGAAYAKPLIPGSNPTLDDIKNSPIDSTNINNRKLGISVLFFTKDKEPLNVWSATTTSRVLIKDLVAKVPPNTNTVSSDWVAVEHAANQAGEQNNYYWFPIGTTTTIWERAPEEQPKVCQNLSAAVPQLLTINQVTTSTGSANNWPMYKLKLSQLQFEDNQIPGGMKVKWKSLDANGKFWNTAADGGLVNSNLTQIEKVFTAPAANNIQNEIYYKGAGPVEVSLSNIPANLNSNACKDTLEIPVINICKELTATINPNPIEINAKKAFPITVNTIKFEPQNSIPANAKINWTSNNPNGEFWKDTFLFGDNPDGSEDIATHVQVGTGTIETATNEKNLYYIGDADDVVTITLSGLAPALVSATCDDQVTIPESEVECKTLKVDHHQKILNGMYSVFKAKAIDTENKSMPNKIKYSVDAGHGSFSVNEPQNTAKNYSPMVIEVGGAQAFKKMPSWLSKNLVTYIISSPKQENFGKALYASIIELDLDGSIGAKEIPSAEELLGPGGLIDEQNAISLIASQETLTVDPNKTVYFIAKKPGVKVIHVETVGAASPQVGGAGGANGAGGAGGSGNSGGWINIPGVGTNGTGYGPGALGDITGAGADISVINGATNYGNYAIGGYTVNLSETEFETIFNEVPDWFITGVDPTPSGPGPDPSPQSNTPGFYGQNSIIDLNLGGQYDGSAVKINESINLENAKSNWTFNLPQDPQVPADPCRRDFDIEPIVCKSLGLITNTKGDLTIGKPMLINVNPKDNNGVKLPATTKFKLTTTTDGKFQSIGSGKFLEGKALLSDFPITLVGATTAGTITVEIDSKDPAYAAICKGEIKVLKEEVECKSLGLTTNTGGDFKVGGPMEINVNPLDDTGKPLPQTTKFLLKTTTDGKFQTVIGSKELGDTAKLSDFPIKVVGVTKAGTVTVSVDPLDPMFNKICSAEIKVVTEEAECVSLSYILNKKTAVGANLPVNELEKNEIYTVSASSVYSKAQADNIVYNVDPAYGTFVKVIGGDNAVDNAALLIKLTQAGKPLDKVTLESIFGAANLTSSITKPGNEKVLLVIYSNVPGAKADVLKINSQGFANAACKKDIPLKVPQGECIALTLSPNTLSGTSDTQYTINQIEHKGSIKVTLTGKGSLKTLAGQTGSTLTFTKEEIAASGGKPVFIYTHDNSFDETTDTAEILVQAINENGQPAPQCQAKLNTVKVEKPQECIDLEITNPDSPWELDEGDDSQTFQISVTTNPNSKKDDLYYQWQVSDCDDCEWDDTNDKEVSEKGDFSKTLNNIDIGDGDEPIVEIFATKSSNKNDTFKDSNGNQICSDYIKVKTEKEEEKPEIDKYTFKKSNLKDADDTANISKDDTYVTFMGIFNTGEGQKSVKIEDENLQNGEIEGSIGGKLVFDDMIINIVENSDTYTILKTDGYSENNTSGKFAEFSDGKADDKNIENFICESENDNKFCIDIVEMDIVEKYNDIDDLNEDELTEKIAQEFKNGKPLAFKNIGKLDGNSKIVIKYQLKNLTKVDDEKCKELNTSKGCGEEFKNKIKFQTYEDQDFKDEKDEGDDSAKVLAICPYILTRQGGDVFFHDLVKTGIDVSQCSEVKNCEGICVTKEKPGDTIINKTGAGAIDGKELGLELPSHDICRFSNTKKGNAVEGYNDVLENFSSTICEFRAEVAEVWKLKNINNAINANIKRIARFMNPSSSTGVIYKTSNYTIDTAEVQNTLLNGSGAKTIIVKGADLIIENNIELYTDSPLTAASSKDIHSAAFIVIDGDIIIKNTDIKRLDGVFIAIDLNLDGSDGQIIQDGISKVPLTINGNLIGNVKSLFENRQGVGDPKKDEGSVTIKYSSRLLLNPPPGLNELLSIQQALVP